jgi:hypothetical protein
MTVGELKKILAQHEDDTLCFMVGSGRGYKFYALEVDVALFDGENFDFDFDESKIDPGHLRKVLVF